MKCYSACLETKNKLNNEVVDHFKMSSDKPMDSIERSKGMEQQPEETKVDAAKSSVEQTSNQTEQSEAQMEEADEELMKIDGRKREKKQITVLRLVSQGTA